MFTYIQYTYILTYTLHTYVHATAVCALWIHTHLKMEFILEGGPEVVTLLSHTNLGGMPESKKPTYVS